MGSLIEQSIPSLFNGVSRQPSVVRMPSQMEEVNNCLLSVVSGGFEKRPHSTFLSTVNLPGVAANWTFHAYERDQFEAYFIGISTAGDIKVFDARTGAEKTVNAYSSQVRAYVTTANPRDDLEIVTVNDYTFVVNRTKRLTLKPAASFTLKGTVKKYDDLPAIRDWPKLGDIWRVRFPNGYPTPSPGQINDGSAGNSLQPEVYLEYTGVNQWTQRYEAKNVPTTVELKGDVKFNSELPQHPPAYPTDGDIWKITQDNVQKVDDYYVRWNNTLNTWEDIADPEEQNEWDLTTMPHALVREADGTFTLKQLPWAPRKVGDAETVKATKLVGAVVNDVFIWKSRIGLLGNEVVQMGRLQDLFNLWPEKATQALDTDPIDRQASENGTTLMRYAVPFRKAVFFTSSRSQFELSATEGGLTPSTATLDLTTTYQTKNTVRPITAGDVLYFASDSAGSALVYEYYFEDSTVTNTAADITKHVFGYIPAPITLFEVDTAIGLLFAKSEAEPGNLFVYTAYFDGNSKVQSAWGRWLLGGDDILYMKLVDGALHVLVQRGPVVTLERFPTSRQAADPGLDFRALLDCRISITGTYNPTTRRTSWTLPFPHRNKVDIVTTGVWGSQSGKLIQPYYEEEPFTVSFNGDWSAYPVFAGYAYEMYAELSKQYVRAEESAVLEGRLQIRSMTAFCEKTGYIEAHVTPEQRPTRIHKMTGRVLGSARNRIGKVAIDDVKFRFRVGSRGDTVKIAFVNPTPYPSCVTAASWRGFFNEISRQEK